MALKKSERALFEAVSSMLQQDAKLGLPISDETSHDSQFRWEGIDDSYALKIADSPFADAINSAFFAVHSHKYIDHPTFKLSFEKEMSARAIPTEEIDQALKYFDELVDELSSKKPSEQDAGWNSQIDDIADMTKNADTRGPKPSKPFTGGGPAPEGDRDTGKAIGESVEDESMPMRKGSMNWLAKNSPSRWKDEPWLNLEGPDEEQSDDTEYTKYCLNCMRNTPVDENGNCAICGMA